MNLLTVVEVAERVKLDETTIRRAIRRGELRASKVCGQLRIREDDFDAWLDDNTVAPAVDIQRAPTPRAPRLTPVNGGPSRSSFRDKVRQQRGAA